MITKFKTSGINFSKIDKVEVERETESSVWIGGRRRSKNTDYECYHDTWNDAKCHLIGLAQADVDKYRFRLERAKSILGNAKGLKNELDN